MTAVTSALVRLYPRAWRQRYGPEMRELLASEKPSLRTYLKRYSPAARAVMSIGGALMVVGLMWAAVAIGYRI